MMWKSLHTILQQWSNCVMSSCRLWPSNLEQPLFHQSLQTMSIFANLQSQPAVISGFEQEETYNFQFLSYNAFQAIYGKFRKSKKQNDFLRLFRNVIHSRSKENNKRTLTIRVSMSASMLLVIRCLVAPNDAAADKRSLLSVSSMHMGTTGVATAVSYSRFM